MYKLSDSEGMRAAKRIVRGWEIYVALVGLFLGLGLFPLPIQGVLKQGIAFSVMLFLTAKFISWCILDTQRNLESSLSEAKDE